VEGFGLVDWKEISNRVRQLFRAKQGLPAEDDLFQGLIHTSDDRERTKLTTRNVYRHAYLNLLADVGGEEWKIARKWAEEERHLFIAEGGERATAFISAIARKQQEQVPVTNITMQNQPTPPIKEEKKGWFHR